MRASLVRTNKTHEKGQRHRKMGMLNSIDGPDESLNEINISLISAPCPASVKVTVDRNAEVPQAQKLVWNKLKNLLSRPAAKANESSGFSFFL